MPSTDDRIVAMQFDNRNFESKVSSTLSMLDKLRQALDFSSAKRSLADLQAVEKNFKLEGIGQAVDSIRDKFSALNAVAFSVISNITNRAVDAGIQMAKSLTLDPVMAGFQEYETNMNSIQTILSNTKADGTSLDQVNAALDKLNTYSDQTIYNFGQMAKNIGTFTAAGVDLDTSVNSIKGIANLAATSGSNAEQASTAMYQLSQAIASGSVKLMDWNSVVNAGMGGEVFQRALFETGKAVGTLTDVPLDQTFDQWKEAGNTFRDSLQDGWITSEVLTNTLSAFTGDLNEQQLISMGYTAAQAKEFAELGKTGKAAATEIKTMTQLFSTVKESIGSGWSSSFRLIFGNFEEAKELFTGVNNAVGGFIGRMSDARNNLLQGWKDLGGRDELINGLEKAFSALGKVIGPIYRAFRDIFPAMTAQRLFDLTKSFGELMDRMKPSYATIDKIQRIFRGLFAALEIGWEVIKGIGGVFGDLISSFAKANGSSVLEFFASIGDSITALNAALVDGGGIEAFFDNILGSVAKLIGSGDLSGAIDYISGLIGRLKDAIGGLFGSEEGGATAGAAGVSGVLKELGERFQWLGDIADAFVKVWEYIGNLFSSLKAVVGDFVGYIRTNFSEFFDTLSNSLTTGNYEHVIGTLQTGLLGGVLLVLRRFVTEGMNLNFNFISGISDTLGELTGVLQAVQTNIKADTLMKVAKALALLTASVFVLSLIDAAALAKALTAMAVGFGQLAGVMAALTAVTSSVGAAAQLAIIATAMIALAGAILILSAAVKVLSTMDLAELAKGLGGVAVLMGILVVALKNMPAPENLIATGVGILAISVGIRVLASAVQVLGSMPLEDMIQGLGGIGAALAAIVIAMNSMPVTGMIAAGVGVTALAIGINILAFAINMFGNMNPAVMIIGISGVAATLSTLSAVIHTMPLAAMPAVGAGLLAIGIGLVAMGIALRLIGGMDLVEMAKGLGGIAALLAILAVATNAMTGAIVGAAAIVVVSGALLILTHVVKEFSQIDTGDLIKGLVGLAATLAILGISAVAMSAAIPALLGLGAALVLIGAGMALFGAGIAGIGFGLKQIAEMGKAGVESILGLFDSIISRLPQLAVELAKGLVEILKLVVAALPGLLRTLGDALVALFQALQDALPELGELIGVLIETLLGVLRENYPDIQAAGFDLLIEFLRGMSDNIVNVTNAAVEILLKFLETITGRMGDIVAKGAELLAAFLQGIAENIQTVIDAGGNIVVNLLVGIAEQILKVADAAGDIIVAFIAGVVEQHQKIIDAGVEAVVKFLEGLAESIDKIVDASFQFILDVINSLADAVDHYAPELQSAGKRLAGEILDGMTFGLAGKVGGVVDGFLGLGGSIIGGLRDKFDSHSPSRVMIKLAGDIADGLAVGFQKDRGALRSSNSWAQEIRSSLHNSLSQMSGLLNGLDDAQPTIAPVLDLTQVRREASKLSGMFDKNVVMASVSIDTASDIASSTDFRRDDDDDRPDPGPKEYNYVQNIHSTRPLSAAEIYRQTKSQLALAKDAKEA